MRQLVDDKNKLARKFAMKNDKKDEFFHSSAYGSSQNEGSIGTASTGLTMAERKAIEEKRKFVQKYNNSKIFESTYNLRHAKKFIPRTEGGENALFDNRQHNRENVFGDASGNVRTSYGRTPGSGDNNAIGIGGMAGKPGERTGGGYTPYKTSSAPAPSRPSGPSFSAGIKPSFK
jgi:hypothetical protein